jgi:hypothetical protein
VSGTEKPVVTRQSEATGSGGAPSKGAEPLKALGGQGFPPWRMDHRAPTDPTLGPAWDLCPDLQQTQSCAASISTPQQCSPTLAGLSVCLPSDIEDL